MTRRPLHPLRPTAVSLDLGPMRLWRDDLAKIVALIKDVYSIDRLQTDRYLIDTLDDLDGVEERTIGLFDVEAGDGRLRLTIKRSLALLTIYDPDLQARGLMVEIKRIAARRRRGLVILSGRARNRFFLTLMAIGGGYSAVATIVSGGKIFTESEWLHIVIAVCASVVIGTVIYPRESGAIMYSKTRAELPTWLSRNRDNLTTNAVVSAIFLVLGIVIGLLFPGR
ncbi:hypothetical protein [Salinispora arenicola]|uniref:hypothetical protein n=1 Tax=Salinispora arenicola TaxID=168697 RepID=UPI0012BCC771|nr:hypothetical protein [Salinispora arenicola]